MYEAAHDQPAKVEIPVYGKCLQFSCFAVIGQFYKFGIVSTGRGSF
jgi:hypothetical protein